MRTLVVGVMITATTVVSTAVLSAETAGVAQYSFTVAHAPRDPISSDGRMRVRLMRWSTDEERRVLTTAMEEPAKLLSALPYGPVAGYLQWPGGLEHSIRYARQTARADGGADIVMVVERPLWVWWDPTTRWAADQQFTVVQLRTKRDGTGQGWIATGDGFKRDGDNGIAISDTTRPALLTDVRHDPVFR